MMCDLCGKPILLNETVIQTQYGQIVNGLFMAIEEARIQHDECEDDDS